MKYFRSHNQLPLWLFHWDHDCYDCYYPDHYDQVVEIISKYEPDETNVKAKQLSKVTPVAVTLVTVFFVVLVVVVVVFFVVVFVVVVFVVVVVNVVVVVMNFAF